MKRDTLRAGLAVGILIVSATAAAGTLRGTVRLSAPAPESDEHPLFYWNVWNGVIDAAEPVGRPDRELAVVLTGEGGDPVGCSYGLSGGGFLSRTMVVKAGSTLRIVNQDACTHELYSETIPEFAPIATAPGNPRSIAVPEGTHVVRDLLYGHVDGVVLAIPDLVACGQVARDGAYVFEGIRPGEYTLKVFHGEQEVHSAPVTVSDTELTVEPIAVGGN